MKYKLHDSVRKNILLSKKLYEDSLLIAKEIGVSFPEYIRILIALDIKRRINPTDISNIDNSMFLVIRII